jgi:hypothetical protein
MWSSCSNEVTQKGAKNALAAAKGFEVELRAASLRRSSRTQHSAAAAAGKETPTTSTSCGTARYSSNSP